MNRFSVRHGIAPLKEIKYRGDIPRNLRTALYHLFRNRIHSRPLCERIGKLFNPYEIDEIKVFTGPLAVEKGDSEDDQYLHRFFIGAEWYYLYELIEYMYKILVEFEEEFAEKSKTNTPWSFTNDINMFFAHSGIGWELVDGILMSRLEIGLDIAQASATESLPGLGMGTANARIRASIASLSTRPDADTEGAISHATSAVECVLGIVNRDNLTLGTHLKRYAHKFHPTIKRAMDGIWGYACEGGARHGKEGIKPTFAEAEFIVATCASLCSFLASSMRDTEASPQGEGPRQD